MRTRALNKHAAIQSYPFSPIDPKGDADCRYPPYHEKFGQGERLSELETIIQAVEDLDDDGR
jgi:hypothetical protein